MAPMTTDLTMLVWSVLLCLLSPFIYVTGLLMTPGGTIWGFGNRDRKLEGEPAWASRARRAHANLVENLVPFAALVLAAQVAGHTNGTTALGAELFFWGRLLYLATYLLGLTPWRTLMFGIGQTGQALILLQLLR